MIKLIEFDKVNSSGVMYSIKIKDQIIESLKVKGYNVVEKDNSIYIDINVGN